MYIRKMLSYLSIIIIIGTGAASYMYMATNVHNHSFFSHSDKFANGYIVSKKQSLLYKWVPNSQNMQFKFYFVTIICLHRDPI